MFAFLLCVVVFWKADHFLVNFLRGWVFLVLLNTYLLMERVLLNAVQIQDFWYSAL